MKNFEKNPQQEAFYASREMIKQSKTLKQLEKNVEKIMAMAKEHKFDETQLQTLEQIGISKYERINRDMEFMMKNRKFGN